MFWKHNPSSSQIDSLLAKEDITLQEVMDSEDIISECRVQNKNLIDFLLKPEVIEELVTLTTREPSLEMSELTRFKYPNIASELLTCDVPVINERIAGDERLLEKLYEFLENEPPLNPLLASYFSKIMGGLIAKKTEQVLDFLKARATFLPLLMKHLGTSAIMDLMLKLMTQVEGIEMRQNILNWLDSQQIIQQLVCLLNPNAERGRHDNVAQLLCDFLRTSRDAPRHSTERVDPDPLLNSLESPDTVHLLLEQIFDKERCQSSIVGGISVLLALLDGNQSSSQDFRSATSLPSNPYSASINDEPVNMEHIQKIVKSTAEVITTRIQDFHNLLLEPPKQPSVLTTVCVLDPPVGQTRLQVVRLLATLIASDYLPLHKQLIDLNTFTVLLDLFFNYPWNNFLHTQVEHCFVTVFETGTTSSEPGGEDGTFSLLCRHLICETNLIERILKAWKDNDEQQSEKKAPRQGYMGHVISLVNHIVRFKLGSNLGDQLKELKPETASTLDEFRFTTLAEVMEQQDELLGGVHPSSLVDSNNDFGDIPFPSSNDLQQQHFTQYQMQNLPAQYIDSFSGFNDDAFNDGDDTLQTIDSASDMNFGLSENEMMQRDAVFKQVCAQSINTLFDAEDQIFEDHDHTFQTVIEKKDQADATENSSDSDDGSPSGGEDNMDVDPWSTPKSDPWNALATTTTTTSNDAPSPAGWADFSSAAFSQPLSFAGVFPVAGQSKSKEETTPIPVPALSKSSNMPQQEATEGSKETSAASGDRPDSERVEVSSGEPQPPSMSLEGDTCKPPNKPLDNLPDKPATEQQGKV